MIREEIKPKTYAENQTENDRKETLQNTWIFASEIPSLFSFERNEEAEQKVVVQTLASQEISRPAVIYDGDILDLIASKNWNYDEAIKIMMCESSGNRYAVNWQDAEITGMPSLGLFQLNRVYDEKYFDPILNISEAYELYLRRGWSPWKNCRGKLAK